MKYPHIHLSYGTRLRPARDWWIIIIIGSLLILASVVWNVVLFQRVSEGEMLGKEGTQSKTILDKNEVEAIIQAFTDRAAEATKYNNGTYRFIDPSK